MAVVADGDHRPPGHTGDDGETASESLETRLDHVAPRASRSERVRSRGVAGGCRVRRHRPGDGIDHRVLFLGAVDGRLGIGDPLRLVIGLHVGVGVRRGVLQPAHLLARALGGAGGVQNVVIQRYPLRLDELAEFVDPLLSLVRHPPLLRSRRLRMHDVAHRVDHQRRRALWAGLRAAVEPLDSGHRPLQTVDLLPRLLMVGVELAHQPVEVALLRRCRLELVLRVRQRRQRIPSGLPAVLAHRPDVMQSRQRIPRRGHGSLRIDHGQVVQVRHPPIWPPVIGHLRPVGAMGDRVPLALRLASAIGVDGDRVLPAARLHHMDGAARVLLTEQPRQHLGHLRLHLVGGRQQDALQDGGALLGGPAGGEVHQPDGIGAAHWMLANGLDLAGSRAPGILESGHVDGRVRVAGVAAVVDVCLADAADGDAARVDFPSGDGHEGRREAALAGGVGSGDLGGLAGLDEAGELPQTHDPGGADAQVATQLHASPP